MKYMITPAEIDPQKFEEIYRALYDLDLSSDALMLNLMQPCDRMLVDCRWSGRTYNCGDIFKPVKTGLGYCCTFNNGQKTPAEKDPDDDDFDTAMGSGPAHGLVITIDIDPSQYVSRIFPFYATTVLVHPPWDFVDSSAFSITVQPGDFALMQISPMVYNSEDILRKIRVSKRGCWFDDEGYLQTGEYSFKNCITECKARAIYKFCRCIPYYYSRKDDIQCTLLDVPCLKKYELIYNNIHLSENAAVNYTRCDCLPQCQDIDYDGYLNVAKDSMLNQFAAVQIFYQHSWCVEYMRSLNMTWDMLLASLGGIFGLCLGGSLISLIELIYYFCMALWKTLLQNKQIVPFKIAPIKIGMIVDNPHFKK